MNNPKEKESKKEYLLIDGTSVTKEEAIRAGEKSRDTFRIIAIFTFVVAVLLLIQYIIDLTIEGSGWVFLIAVELFLIGSGLLFIMIYRNLDTERHGVSILNARHRMTKVEPKDTLVFNDIQADILLELHVQYGNLFFIDSAKSRWQYRLNNHLSDVFGIPDVKEFSIKKDGVVFDPAKEKNEESDHAKHDYCIEILMVDPEKKPISILCKSEEVIAQFQKDFQNFLSGKKA